MSNLMWDLKSYQYEIGPFLFIVSGDPQSLVVDGDESGRLMIRCEYDSNLSDNFVAYRPESNSEFIPGVHVEYGKIKRPWFGRDYNPWDRLFSCDSQIELVNLMSVEIARHWLYEATGYELQHLTDAGYLEIQEWFLESNSKEA